MDLLSPTTIAELRAGPWWPRCVRCCPSPIATCPTCPDEGPFCSACVQHNPGSLARHPQSHSQLLDMCLDTDLVAFVEALNGAGLRTIDGCVGALGLWLDRSYVAFASTESATTLISRLLSASRGTDFHERLRGSILIAPTQRWEITLSVSGDEVLTYIATVLFPIADVALALDALLGPGETPDCATGS